MPYGRSVPTEEDWRRITGESFPDTAQNGSTPSQNPSQGASGIPYSEALRTWRENTLARQQAQARQSPQEGGSRFRNLVYETLREGQLNSVDATTGARSRVEAPPFSHIRQTRPPLTSLEDAQTFREYVDSGGLFGTAEDPKPLKPIRRNLPG